MRSSRAFALLSLAALSLVGAPSAVAAEPQAHDNLGAVASTDTSSRFTTGQCGVPTASSYGWYSDCIQYGWGVTRRGRFNYSLNKFVPSSAWSKGQYPVQKLLPYWHLRGNLPASDGGTWETHFWMGADQDIKPTIYGWTITAVQWRKTKYVSGVYNLSANRFFPGTATTGGGPA